MAAFGPGCVKTQSYVNFRGALTIPGPKQIDCGVFDEGSFLWVVTVSSFSHSLGRFRSVKIYIPSHKEHRNY